ncbi:hypothetical protein SMAC4_14032 [Sordaria macrospora]|uniref:uncharacterized protein n=1 Tax=Sordaria macrospora TaxID=5147 RepID=UPI002B2D3980|nr:hypothetical protein SMAC4_14032 [Sordaria macrospora]
MMSRSLLASASSSSSNMRSPRTVMTTKRAHTLVLSSSEYADDPAHFASNHSAAPKEACSPEPGPARCSTRYDYPASADLCGVLIDDIIGDMYRGSPYFANKINCSDHNKAPASSVPSVTPASTLNKTGAVTKMSTIATSTPTSHPHPPFHGNRKVSFLPYSPRSVCLFVASTQKQCCVSWADNLRQGRKNGASIVEALPGYFFRNGKQVLDKCVVGEHVYGKVQDTRVGLDCTTQCISGSVKSGCWRDE